MSRFVYYNNDFTVQGNPENGQHIYNYLTGKWKDGLDITYGEDGRVAQHLQNLCFLVILILMDGEQMDLSHL